MLWTGGKAMDPIDGNDMRRPPNADELGSWIFRQRTVVSKWIGATTSDYDHTLPSINLY